MKDAITALTARSMYLFHAGIAFWRVKMVLPSMHWVWFLLCPILTLCAETVYTIVYRGGEDFNWISPAMALYLMSVVPPIWFLEYYEFTQYQQTSVCADAFWGMEDAGCDYIFGHRLNWTEQGNGTEVGFIQDENGEDTSTPLPRYSIVNELLEDPKFEELCTLEQLFLYDTGTFLNVTSVDNEGWYEHDIIRETWLWGNKSTQQRIKDETRDKINWDRWETFKAKEQEKIDKMKANEFRKECEQWLSDNQGKQDKDGIPIPVPTDDPCYVFLFDTTTKSFEKYVYA